MAAENSTEVPLKEGNSCFSDRQVETPTRKLSETGLIDPIINPAGTLKKMGYFELSD